jgi:hypothetical protein
MDATYFETYLDALDACPDYQGILGDEFVIHPPTSDCGYESTPPNALVFGCMGVDGVHYAILTIDGIVSDESPVLQICPMDFSDLYHVMGCTFLSFLADGCGVSDQMMKDVFAEEQSRSSSLIVFLKEHFQVSRLWDDERSEALKPYLRYIQSSM